MSLDKDFKADVKREFKEGDYIGRKVALRVFVAVLIIAVLGAVGGVTYQKWRVDQDRKIFKQSASYNEGVLDDLAKYKYEMTTESTPVGKAAIAELVNSRFANYDITKIENMELVGFLKDCRNGEYAVKGE